MKEECLHGVHPANCDECSKDYHPYDLEYDYMKAGDYVEFLSDKQTEKGPSSGKIKISMGDQLLIEHSDCTEEFKRSKLQVHKQTTHHKGGILWQLT